MGNPHPRKTASSPCILSRPLPSKKIIKPVIRVVQIHNPVYVQTDALNFPSLVQKLTGMHALLPISHPPHPPRRSAAPAVFNHPPLSSSSLDDEICRWSCTDDFHQSHTTSRSSDQIRHWSSCADDFNRPHTSPHTSRSYEICRWSSRGAGVASPADESFEWKHSGAALRRRSSCSECPRSCSTGFQNDASSSYEASSPNNTSGSSEGIDYEYGDAFSNMSVGVQRFSELDIWAGLASDHALPDITMLPPLLF